MAKALTATTAVALVLAANDAANDKQQPLTEMTMDELRPVADALGLNNTSKLDKTQLIKVIVEDATDPFRDLPTVSAGEYEIRDLTAQETSEPRKYTAVQEAAAKAKLHMKANWKYRDTVFKIGATKADRKEGSVMGNIQQIVRSHGATGVPAPVLIARLRQLSLGNKRSHFCNKLPPVGWAEDYIRGAMSEGLIKDAGKYDHKLDVIEEAKQVEAQTEQKVAANG